MKLSELDNALNSFSSNRFETDQVRPSFLLVNQYITFKLAH